MTQDNRPIDSAVQPCGCVKHDFQVLLAAAPDASPRPAWWPADSSAFGGEQMSITLGGVEPQQALDGGGTFRTSDIPPGVAQVHFDAFYDDIRAELERRTNIDSD